MSVILFTSGKKDKKSSKEPTKVKTVASSGGFASSTNITIEDEAYIFSSNCAIKISELPKYVGDEVEIKYKKRKTVIKPEGVYAGRGFHKWKSNFSFKKFLVKDGVSYFDGLSFEELVEGEENKNENNEETKKKKSETVSKPQKKKKESTEKPVKKVKIEEKDEKQIKVLKRVKGCDFCYSYNPNCPVCDTIDHSRNEKHECPNHRVIRICGGYEAECKSCRKKGFIYSEGTGGSTYSYKGEPFEPYSILERPLIKHFEK